MRSPARDQRGLSESVQYAVIFPMLMLVTLGIIQAGIWIHGHNVAVRAASAGVDVGRGSYGNGAQARETAIDIAAAGGLEGATVDVAQGSDSISVTVKGRAPMILDVGLGQIAETASAPLERVTQP